jgi:hypothetical protein
MAKPEERTADDINKEMAELTELAERIRKRSEPKESTPPSLEEAFRGGLEGERADSTSGAITRPLDSLTEVARRIPGRISVEEELKELRWRKAEAAKTVWVVLEQSWVLLRECALQGWMQEGERRSRCWKVWHTQVVAVTQVYTQLDLQENARLCKRLDLALEEFTEEALQKMERQLRGGLDEPWSSTEARP